MLPHRVTGPVSVVALIGPLLMMCRLLVKNSTNDAGEQVFLLENSSRGFKCYAASSLSSSRSRGSICLFTSTV